MWLLILFSFVICLFTCVTNKQIKYHPVILFNGVWLVIFILYKIDYLNFTILTDHSIAILLIMIFFFPLGVLLGLKNRYRVKRHGRLSYVMSTYEFREKLFWALCILASIVMLIDELTIIIRLIQGASFYDIMRDASGKGTVEISGSLQVLLYLFVVYPVSYLVSPICAVKFINGSQNKYRYLAINLIIVALSVAHHGGRKMLFLFGISYILAYLIYGKKAQTSRKTKWFVVIILVLLVVIMNEISVSRGIDDVGTSFYAYLTCSPSLMQTYLSSSIVSSQRLFGFFSFNGFVYPIMILPNYLGIKSPAIYQTTQTVRFFIENSYVPIGGYSHNMNAFLPVGAYFYVDGGFAFEIIGMVLYGMLAGYLYKKVLKNRDEYNCSLYIFVCIGLILSFARFYFTSYAYAFAFLYVCFLFKKRDNLVDNKR
ncbi:oligosaccharide repeat unit polymerase [Desulfosporosinus fructosivorans]|uniref:Oligosaccharide repeat unit polymerase n=1 Tax=Desulfosporosinus fructosivorans TaxID=2018669 RepID=A0A4Z0RBN0_9FIRM|nr:O-antigen polymerase [Desulfosporosinus fructosivorans]TGE39735.1 oligosaccharide repeat unit polymerase [Desulfosporosinus fructosivorans]